jgi:predicted Rossmann fold flavoprotein
MKNDFDLIVIGGGAAGLMGAITAGERGLKVLLLEKGSQLCRKVLISGGGRCNVTNNKHSNPRDFLSQYPRGGKFLWGPYSRFTQHDTINWFESRGLKLKTETDGRVFPITDSSKDVMNVLLQAAIKAKVEIRLNQQVKKLLFSKEDKQVLGIQLIDGSLIESKNILVACGGMSYQKTGSTGDAYQWAVEAGHKVIPAKPSLTGLLTQEKWLHELKGVSLQNIELKLENQVGLSVKETGAFLFTHWGITGPGIFKITSLAAGTDYSQNQCILILNLVGKKPHEVESGLKEAWQRSPKRKALNCLNGLLPERLEKTIIERIVLNTGKTCAEISKLELHKLSEFLTALKVPISGSRPSGEEIVTAGGVCLDEVDPKTMESRLVKGLYWAGEVLDIDGFTGGYNLQSAWSTGHLAGENIIC